MLLPIISLAVFTKRLRRFRRSQDGSAAVEFAMIAPMFFALIFAIMETGMVFLAGQVLETGVQDGARLVYTSQSASAADFKSAICGRVSSLMDCNKLDIDVRSYDAGTTITISDPIDAGGNYVPGGLVYQPPSYPSSKTVVVRGFYQWPLYVTGLGYNIANVSRGTSNSKRLLAATAAVGPQ
ncbi:pilus assembly protein [Tardiphaga alba]|uniref:Pilus assembly protein n=1 Tax=Tardiphaga alba TaxID=340268 RepID=A0ABX8AGA9_9BRAD|nr:TadE/TadG family type IV pilus assembly protein [Tardiphaga alba]QUS41448.1 pilus assembly protein [Tardiphaga alba]